MSPHPQPIRMLETLRHQVEAHSATKSEGKSRWLLMDCIALRHNMPAALHPKVPWRPVWVNSPERRKERSISPSHKLFDGCPHAARQYLSRVATPPANIRAMGSNIAKVSSELLELVAIINGG